MTKRALGALCALALFVQACAQAQSTAPEASESPAVKSAFVTQKHLSSDLQQGSVAAGDAISDDAVSGGAVSGDALAGECLTVNDVLDRDVRRNAAILQEDPALCLRSTSFVEHGRKWALTIIENTAAPQGLTVFVLHDNEQAAFDTALYSVRAYGGRMIAVETGDRRIFRNQDPNRNFGTTSGETRPCRQMARKPAPVFTETLLSFRQGEPDIYLTLHNNDDGFAGNGGRGTISAARKSRVMQGLRPEGVPNDEDDAVLLAGLTRHTDNLPAQDVINAMHAAGINVIYERVRPDLSDCSFSNYVVLNGLGRYFNIEAQHGHGEEQRFMLDALMSHLGIPLIP